MGEKKFLFKKKEFDGWKTLNDTVMGGSSSAYCEISNSGLLLKGNIVEKAGGLTLAGKEGDVEEAAAAAIRAIEQISNY